MTLLTRSAFALLAMGLLCSPSRIQAAQKKTSPAAVQAAREHQAEAYQARLRMVRARLRARLPKQAAPAEPPLRAEPASDPAPALAPRQHCPPARPACFRAATPAPSHMGLLRFLFLALTLFNLFPCTGADLLRPLPDPGPPMPEAHARYAADQTARFNATFGLTLAQSPRLPVTGLAPAGTAAADFGTAPAAPPASAPATLGELLELAGPGSVGELNVRLARFRQWTAQARAATAGGPGEPAPFPLALNSQLAALDNLSLGMQLATTGYLARILSPAEAIASLSLASDTLLNVVNSFRVAAQGRTLDLFPPALAQLGSQLNETRAGLREDQLRAARDQALPAASTPPEDAPGPVRPDRQRKACCEVADLVDQLGIHRVIGASGAANVAAYLVATEAAAGIAGVDLLSARNRSLPAPLLAAADMGAATAVGLGSVVLGDPPPAAGTPDGAPQADATGSLADRCARFRCENAITQVQAQVAGETLAGSIMNLVGYILYSSAAQLTLAMEAESAATAASAPAPLNGTGGAAWTEGLMRQFRRQTRAILPAGSGPALLATVPGVAAPAAAAPAAAGVPAGIPAADPPPAAACAACPCELSFSLAQLGSAEEIRSGAGLAQLAYTLNLVVKAFRIALAAGT